MTAAQSPSRTDRRPKVGVLTFHRCINYGSYWQARCLVEGIAARGHDAVLLDHVSRGVTSQEWRYAFQPLLPDRSGRADIRAYGRKLRRFTQAFDALPLSAPFDLDDPAGIPRFDVVVIGSDEVLNLSHPWYGGKRLFWGEGVAASRVVTYAASSGNMDADGGLAPDWRARLGRLDAISVRDENTRAVVQAATGRTPEMVLDPVLQFPPNVAPADEPAPYLLVYGHHIPDWFAARVRDAARRRGWRTISVGYRNDWADEQRLDAGPHDFAALVAGAAAFLGHLFPVWLGFKGGKGVATFLGTLIALHWPLGLIACAIWLLTAAVSRISSLSALLAAALSPVFAWGLGRGDLIAVSLFMAVLIFIRHSANITRLMDGSEPRIGRKT